MAARVPSVLGRNHFRQPQDRARRKHLCGGRGFWSASSLGGNGGLPWREVRACAPSRTTRRLTSSGRITPDAPAEQACLAQRPSALGSVCLARIQAVSSACPGCWDSPCSFPLCSLGCRLGLRPLALPSDGPGDGCVC